MNVYKFQNSSSCILRFALFTVCMYLNMKKNLSMLKNNHLRVFADLMPHHLQIFCVFPTKTFSNITVIQTIKTRKLILMCLLPLFNLQTSFKFWNLMSIIVKIPGQNHTSYLVVSLVSFNL